MPYLQRDATFRQYVKEQFEGLFINNPPTRRTRVLVQFKKFDTAIARFTMNITPPHPFLIQCHPDITL